MVHVSTYMCKSPTLQFWEPYKKTPEHPKQNNPNKTPQFKNTQTKQEKKY